MKRLFSTLTFLLLSAACLHAQNIQVKQSDYSRVQISFTTPTPQVNDVSILKQTFSQINMDGYDLQSVAGMPALPALVKIIEVPLGEGLNYNIDNIVLDTIDAATIGITDAIVPAQPSRSKSDTSPITLAIDRRAYSTNAFCGNSTIELEAIGVARSSNLARLTFNPLRWNPVTNQLIVVKSITVSIRQQNADIAATRRMKRLHTNGAFDCQAINSIDSKDAFQTTPLRYTIVAHSMFHGELDDFALWKKRQGFIVDLVYTDDANVGGTINSIKAYLQSLYDNATEALPAPTFVLFVGDVEQIPASIHYYSNDHHYSDLDYCCWTPNDYLPDCYYGRFSAQNNTDLQSQISKTLMYEQYTFPDDSYLSKAALIAGVDGGYSTDNAYKYADPTMDYIAKTYVTNANGFNSITYYKNNTSFAPTGVTVTGSSQSSTTANALKTLYNQGCGWVNYSAHGGTTSWSNPSFNNNHVAAMTNNNKPMFMIGNCCLTNSFQIDACFGEALLRKGNNAGACIYIGGSNSTYWKEDFYWSVGVRNNISNTCNPSYNASHLGMYDHLFHSHGEPFTQHFVSAGAMIFAGNAAVESSTSTIKEYYWQVYHVMGDPSLVPYIHGTANDATAYMPATLSVGCNNLTIQTEPYAYIGFTDNNHNLVAAAFADENGDATLTFEPLTEIGEFEVAITAQGFKPYIQTINITSNGPYISVNSLTPNSQLTANGDINFTAVIQNYGPVTADTVTIEYISTDNRILLDTTGQLLITGGVQTGETITLNGVCSGHIWGNVPDQSVATIKVIVRWGTHVFETSTTTFHYTVNADNVKLNSHILNNHFADNGIATLTMNNINDGHAPLDSATVTLTCLDPIISIANNSVGISNIAPGQIENSLFNLSLNGPMPEQRKIPLLQTINNGFRTNCDTIYIMFGVDNSLITYEDSTFGNFQWTHSTKEWQITSQQAYNGNYCMRSHKWSGGYIGNNTGNNDTTTISVTCTSTYDDSITFYIKVSTEANYDKFYFLIDGNETLVSSGEVDWQRAAFEVPAGTHTFTFGYGKDYSVSNGLDGVFVDDLHLPGTNFSGVNYILDTVCRGEEYLFNADTIETVDLEAGNHIYYDSTDESEYYLTLVVREAPSINIIHTADTIRAGETVRLDATTIGVERYAWNTGENNPIINVYPTTTTTYTVTGFQGLCFSEASVTIYVEGTIGTDSPEKPSMKVYPNPATNQITVEGDNISTIKIYDIMGRMVSATKTTDNRTAIDISSLNAGIYFLITESNNGKMQREKIMKK